ncbi:DUF4019 domain-containing protein [Sphingomonas suaedae]|nr:DUF4019 domain-containing protein [Sphingomonas suaedae]
MRAFDCSTIGSIALFLGAIPANIIVIDPAPARADATVDSDSKEDAESAALSFVTRFEEGDPGEIYDEELSPSFKALTARQNFVQQSGFLRLQSGGRALARELIGSQPFTQTPTGQVGTFYYIRFRTRHPNGLVYQDVYLERVDSAWKIAGFYTIAAPQQ